MFFGPASKTRELGYVGPDAVPPILQTENAFTSLTNVVHAVLQMYGHRIPADIVAGQTGDCFALQLDPKIAAAGITSAHTHLEQSMADLGLESRSISDAFTPDSYMRVCTVIRAGIRNYRPSLVCGGWPAANAIRRHDRYWGLVCGSTPDAARFTGVSMQEAFESAPLTRELTWPDDMTRCTGAYIVESWAPPRMRQGRALRRALTRGVSFLSGELGFGGQPALARLVRWLQTERIDEGTPASVNYPFPMMVAVRSQFEAMTRYMRRGMNVIPITKRGALRRCGDLAQKAAELLLDAEPARTVPRNASSRIATAPYPWGAGAWENFALYLREPKGAMRLREVARIEELRQIHAQLLEAVDFLVAG